MIGREKASMEYKIILTKEELDDLKSLTKIRIDELKDECVRHCKIIESLETKFDFGDDVALDAAKLLYNESSKELKRNCEIYEKLDTEMELVEND